MYSIGADTTPIDCLYVSHQSGQDTPQCGSRTEPCQTLPQALWLVRDGGKICLDGRNSERHPYSCFFRDIVLEELGKSVAIIGLFTKAHITCDPRYGNLIFRYPENRLFKLILSNLVFHNYGVDLKFVSCFNVWISSCKFINSSSSNASVFIVQKEWRIFPKSSIVVTDSEFLHNNMSIFAILYKGLFTLRISRCVFQGTKGRFNGVSGEKNLLAAVCIRYAGYPANMVKTVGVITDCRFQDLGHEDNSFALLFRSYGIYDSGNLSVFNSTFLCNENAMLVVGGFHVQLRHVTINSTYGYALFGAGPTKINDTVPDLKLLLDHCTLSNNRIGIRMTTSFCPPDKRSCPPSSKILSVKDSLFVGGSETRQFGDAIRLLVDAIFSVRRPSDLKCKVTLENVTFQEFHNSVLYVEMQRNVTGLINVTNCKFLNNSYFAYHLDEKPTVNIIFKEEDPPKCLNRTHNSKFLWCNKTQFPVIFENSIFQNNVAITGALNLFNVNATFKNCTFKDNAGSTLGGHIYMKIGYGSLNIINSNFLQSRLKPHSNVEPWRISNVGCFLYSESVGPVIIRNSSFSANINKKLYPILAVTKSSLLYVDATSTIKCPSARWLKMDNNQKTKGFTFTKGGETCWIDVRYVKIFCEECPSGFYSLQRGFISGLNKNKETKCLKCPYGASCKNGKIKAKENFFFFWA